MDAKKDICLINKNMKNRNKICLVSVELMNDMAYVCGIYFNEKNLSAIETTLYFFLMKCYWRDNKILGTVAMPAFIKLPVTIVDRWFSPAFVTNQRIKLTLYCEYR